MQTQSCPVTESNRNVAGLPVLVLEPGAIGWWLGSRRSAGTGQYFSPGIAKSHLGENVADQAPAFPAGPAFLPFAHQVFISFSKKLPALA